MYSFHNRNKTVRLRVKKSKIAVAIILMFVLLLTVGCGGSSETSTTPEREYEIVKVIKVDSQSAEWQIYQLQLKIEGGGKFTIDLNLADGAMVEGYYKLEKPTEGGNVGFQIRAGTSVIYTSTQITSDKFSFTASPTYGTSYRLVFENNLPDVKSKETIYAEISYQLKTPGEDSIFIPLNTK
jgi:hypothetical protein